MTVTFKGTPMALVGTPLQVGGTMPDFTLGLLTRAVFVAVGDGEVTYVEYVPEVSDHPDYDAVLRRLQSLV